jgi:hypothetical protein
MATDMDGRRVPPLFDPAVLDALPELSAPPAARLLGHAVAARRLASLAEPLRSALRQYASRLYAWGMGAIEEIANAASTSGASGPDHALPPELDRLRAVIDAWEMDSTPPSGA